MAAVGTRTMIWEGGEHPFCLSQVGHILQLQEATAAGVMEVLRRIQTQTWRLEDIRETIRLGLIGGGMDAEKAMGLVKAYVDNNVNGLAPSVILAMNVLETVILGVPKDDPVGKATAPEDATGPGSTMPTAASGAPQSTESGPRSSGRRAKSMR